MDGSLVPASCQVISSSPGDYRCPATGWQGIETYLSVAKNMEPYSYLQRYGVAGPPAVEISGRSSLRSLHVQVEGPSNFETDPAEDPQPMGAISQKSAVADALSTTARLWSVALQNVTTSGHGSALNQLDAIHSIENGYYQPYTLASCEFDVIQGPNDQRPVGFPPSPGTWTPNPKYNDSILYGINSDGFNISRDAVVFAGLTRSDILMTPGPPDETRLRWVELPQDGFNGSTIGAVVLLSRFPDEISQELVMCTVSAGWGTSGLNVSTRLGVPNTVLSEPTLKDDNSYSSPVPEDPERKAAFFQGLQAADSYGFYGYPFFPQRKVTVSEEWAEYLNPSIIGLNTTVFNHLMTLGSTVLNDAQIASIILTSLLANGLSNIGSDSHLQGDLKGIVNADGSIGIDGAYWFSGKGNVMTVDPVESKDWVKFHVDSTIEGYAYNIRGASPKVAICFLLLYCVVALTHTFYSIISGVSSTCWDSIGEVTALAMNSTPTTVLRNTCAGISELRIYKLPVRVLAMRDEEGDGEHLELVFGNGLDEKVIEDKMIKKNRVYGTVAAQKEREKYL